MVSTATEVVGPNQGWPVQASGLGGFWQVSLEEVARSKPGLEGLNQARKRELHERIAALLSPLLSILCDGCFYTHLFYSANPRQAVLVLFSERKLRLRQAAMPQTAPWAFQKHKG